MLFVQVSYRFLANLEYHEKVGPSWLPTGDWRRYSSATEWHICNESLVKVKFPRPVRRVPPQHGQLSRSMPQKLLLPGQEGVCGASDKKGTKAKRPKGPESKDCIPCQTTLLMNNYRDAGALKDHCNFTRKYRGLRAMPAA